MKPNFSHYHAPIVNDDALDIIFREGRSFSYWQEKPVSDVLLHALYDLVKMGPTSANSCPMRVVFIKTSSAKEKLKPALDAGNIEKTMTAPVTAIIAYDRLFYNQLPQLFPHANARDWFAHDQEKADKAALHGSTLQAAYLFLAARSLGLDCGPMQGFNAALVDELFLTGSEWKSNLLCNIGYGDRDKLHPRQPRLEFGEACRII
ncbi:MAG: malonic semialdehyde reductase [Alphaproteobacteria bacterium]